MKKLLLNLEVSGAVNLLSSDTIPEKFCHLLVHSPRQLGRTMIHADIVRSAKNGDSSYLLPGGEEPHEFAGVTTHTQNPNLPPRPDEQPRPAQGRDGSLMDVFLPGHVSSYVNGWNRDGEPVSALKCTKELHDALHEPVVLWRDGGSMVGMGDAFKRLGGAPLTDLDEIESVNTILSVKGVASRRKIR